VTLQRDNAAMRRIVRKDKLMGFTMIVGEYLLDCISYYPYNINEPKKFDIIVISTNKKVSTQ
jgi:hypothetical protein